MTNLNAASLPGLVAADRVVLDRVVLDSLEGKHPYLSRPGTLNGSHGPQRCAVNEPST
jgi:hypothetical protein